MEPQTFDQWLDLLARENLVLELTFPPDGSVSALLEGGYPGHGSSPRSAIRRAYRHYRKVNS